MTWVTWRQQRSELLIAAAILALVAALLIPTGLHMASVYDHNGLAACVADHSRGCQDATHAFTARFERTSSLIAWLNLIPGIIGVLLAAPFILELESGTYKLAWTQSITRRRWLAGKLGLTVAAALVSGLALTALTTWWRIPLDHMQGRMQTNVFDFEGIVGFGYVLFALGLSLAVGVVWRRTAPALIVGFVGYTAARLFVQLWLRQRYEAPLASTTAIAEKGAGPDLSNAWVLHGEPSDKFGHPMAQTLDVLQACGRALGKNKALIDPSCLARHGGGYNHVVYHPASRFWLFQGIETAIFAGVGVALILLAAGWVHERVS
jgi:hypothetical protein